MGHRLEAARLAEDLGVSMSPVRDALNRLLGERLVGLVPGMGFHVPRLTERQVRDMLRLHQLLLLQAAKSELGSTVPYEALPSESYADRAAGLFAWVAALSGNAELVEAVQNIGSRLHCIRLREVALQFDPAADLERVMAAFTSSPGEIEDALIAYHEIRIRNADRLLAR